MGELSQAAGRLRLLMEWHLHHFYRIVVIVLEGALRVVRG